MKTVTISVDEQTKIKVKEIKSKGFNISQLLRNSICDIYKNICEGECKDECNTGIEEV